MLANQIMSQPVSVCQTKDSLSQAAKLMWELDCGVVPVVDNEGRAVAMLTDRDICMAAYTQGTPLREISVCVAMSRSLVACHPDDTLARVEELMMEHQIRRLPVIDWEGRPIGILSLNDLARAANNQHPAAPCGEHEISPAAVAGTLAAICAPRLQEAGPRLV